MNQFEHKAAVAPRTVTEISEGKHDKPPRTGRRKPKQKKAEIFHIKVDKRVWKKALELAKGNPKRLVVESNEAVIVCHTVAQAEERRKRMKEE